MDEPHPKEAALNRIFIELIEIMPDLQMKEMMDLFRQIIIGYNRLNGEKREKAEAYLEEQFIEMALLMDGHDDVLDIIEDQLIKGEITKEDYYEIMKRVEDSKKKTHNDIK